MTNWEKFRDLPPGHRLQFIRATALLAAVGVALKVVPFRVCRSTLAVLAGEPATDDDGASLRRARNLTELVRAAGRHGPTGFTCLRESLVLWYLLRRDNIRSELRIGVRKDGADLAAHAWVEMGGRVLNDADDVHDRFSAFDHVLH